MKLPAPTVRKRHGVRLFAAAFVVAIGEAALALVPDVGPFGAYWISDQLKADEYARLIDNTASEARRCARSRYRARREPRVANRRSSAAQGQRLPALKAHAAFIGYLRELRFGVDGPVRARAKVLLDEARAGRKRAISRARARGAKRRGGPACPRQEPNSSARTQGPE